MEFVAILLIVLGIPVIGFLVILDRLRQLTARVAQLEWELKSALGERAVAQHGAVPGQELPRTPAVSTPPAEPPAAQREVSPPTFTPPPPPQLERVPVPEGPPSRTRQEWEAVIGGKLLNRIGALALILGAGFFLKYAFDNDWISEPIRVLIGVLVGAVLLAFGARTHRKGLAVFAQGIQGAGIAILYLSVYAAYDFYHLVPHIGAFTGMAVVTGIAFLVGLRFDSQPTALLGWLGGYLTPIILATDQANLVGLSIYLAILAGGMVALQLKRPDWTLLTPLSVAANAVIFLAAWTTNTATEAERMFAYAVLVIYWCIYAIPAVSHHRAGRTELTIRKATEIMNGLLILLCLCVIKYEFGMHITAGVAIGIVAALTAGMFVYVRHRQVDSPFARMQYSVMFVLTAAIAIKLGIGSTEWEIIALAIAAAAFVWLGVWQKIDELWRVACLLFLPVAGLMFWIPRTFQFEPIAQFQLVWHLRTLVFIVPALSIISIIAMIRPNQSDSSKSMQAVLHAGWITLLFLFLTTETNDYFRYLLTAKGLVVLSAANEYARNLTLAVLWMFLAVPVVVLGVRRSVPAMTVTGVGVGAVGVLLGIFAGMPYDPVSRFTLLVNIRFATVLLLLAGIYVIGRELRRVDHPLANRVADIGQFCLALIPVILFSAEAWAAFGRRLFETQSDFSHGQDAITQIRNLRQLVLSGIWLIYSLILIAIGIFKRLQPVRLMAIGLFALAILKIFIYDLSFLQTLYRIFSFVGLGLILLAVSYAYQRYKDVIFGAKAAPTQDETMELHKQ